MIAEEENMHKETEKEDEKLKQEQEKVGVLIGTRVG